MSGILVSGSIAYDFIMDHGDDFSNSINKDNLDNLSVSFFIHKLKKEMGGTGLNIAYNFAMLGEKSILLGAAGDDFIFDGFMKEKINLNYLHISTELLSASCYIISDPKSKQINAFYPGAMDMADTVSVNDVSEELHYGIVSPNKKEAMLQHIQELSELGVKSFFDPGQIIFLFGKEELEQASKYADYLIVNEYEFEEFKQKIGKNEGELLKDYEKIIVTLGGKGAKIIDSDGETLIEAVKIEKVVDPTGAGDAFRAGLIIGLKGGYDFETSAKIGSICGAECVQSHGGQNHSIHLEMIEKTMKENYQIDIKF
ncbi:carbohydrate kinase family protein [Candidatus Gracilibacteria bacterium 28_42_T64]|nr:carbohydrate kinase family protein [Candidatus Gracilibacteria bacterium 28_42_T64]